MNEWHQYTYPDGLAAGASLSRRSSPTGEARYSSRLLKSQLLSALLHILASILVECDS